MATLASSPRTGSGATRRADDAPPTLKAARHGNRSTASVVFLVALWFALAFSVLCLAVLLINAFVDGASRLDANLFTQYSSRLRPDEAGARAAILGSAWVIAATAVMAIPLGVAAGLYLEEFADNRRWYNRLIEVNLTNLAAVPAIVYGMLTAGLALTIGLERRVVLAGALALALRRLVFGRVVVALRLLERLELDDDVARPRLALELLDRTAAHERLAAVFADRLGGVLDVRGVLLGVRHDDAGDDVAFGHGGSSM